MSKAFEDSTVTRKGQQWRSVMTFASSLIVRTLRRRDARRERIPALKQVSSSA